MTLRCQKMSFESGRRAVGVPLDRLFEPNSACPHLDASVCVQWRLWQRVTMCTSNLEGRSREWVRGHHRFTSGAPDCAVDNYTKISVLYSNSKLSLFEILKARVCGSNHREGPLSSEQLMDILFKWYSHAIDTFGPARCSTFHFHGFRTLVPQWLNVP